MERTSKVWGERWLLREDSTHATSVLHLIEGTRCSWHRHRAKFNLFVVISGHIQIVVQEQDEKRGIEVLGGQTFTVPPGVYHEFQALADSVVVEEMFVSYDEGDIVRLDSGGYVKDEG